MSHAPQVTVLMPNYNNASFLREAIDSILNQTFTNFVFLIVDDGSTDESVKLIQTYTDPRIQLVLKSPNSGIVDTLNLGLEKIDTKYFVRMDADDISTPDRLEVLFHYMEKNPQVGVCGSYVEIFGAVNENWVLELDRDKIKARTIFSNGVVHAPSIFRTEILRKNKIWYTNRHPYMEDYDLFFRLKHFTEFAHVDKVLYRYRVLDHNSTVKNRDTAIERYKAIYTRVLEELDIMPDEKNLDLHVDFFLGGTPRYPFSEYKRYTELLLSKNQQHAIYPHKALKKVIEEKWDYLFFKVVPLSLGKNMKYFWLSGKITWKQFSYLSKYKINRLLGRKN